MQKLYNKGLAKQWGILRVFVHFQKPLVLNSLNLLTDVSGNFRFVYSSEVNHDFINHHSDVTPVWLADWI